MKKLVGDVKFSKLLAQVRRSISDASGLLQEWLRMDQQEDATIQSILAMTLGCVKVFRILSMRNSVTESLISRL